MTDCYSANKVEEYHKGQTYNIKGKSIISIIEYEFIQTDHLTLEDTTKGQALQLPRDYINIKDGILYNQERY